MLQVAVIGEYDEDKPTHPATTRALVRAGQVLGQSTRVSWISTAALASGSAFLDPYDAFVASPGTPYADFQGALAGIRYAREHGRPFLGT